MTSPDTMRRLKAWIYVSSCQMPHEEFKDTVLGFIEKHESMLREKFPDNPGLALLDEERLLGRRSLPQG